MGFCSVAESLKQTKKQKKARKEQNMKRQFSKSRVHVLTVLAVWLTLPVVAGILEVCTPSTSNGEQDVNLCVNYYPDVPTCGHIHIEGCSHCEMDWHFWCTQNSDGCIHAVTDGSCQPDGSCYILPGSRPHIYSSPSCS